MIAEQKHGWEYECNACKARFFDHPTRNENYGFYCSMTVDICPSCSSEEVRHLKFHNAETGEQS